MLRCIIVDDHLPSIKILSNYIEKTPFLHLLNTFIEPVTALSFLQSESVDLIFSDIEMPDLTGLEFLKLLDKQYKVILSTAYSEYALQGYEHNVVDYLLKPVSFERFLKAAHKAYVTTTTHRTSGHIESQEGYILLKTGVKGSMRKVQLQDIWYVEGLKNYVSIYTQNDRIIALLNIKDLEKKLPSNGFMRVHKSYVVAISRMIAIEGNQIIVGHDRSQQKIIPLGATYREAFFHTFQDHIIGKK